MSTTSGAPRFEFDPSWPKPLPAGWITGQLPCVYVDHHDHILIVNRGKTRADELAALKVGLPVGEVLPSLVEALHA